MEKTNYDFLLNALPHGEENAASTDCLVSVLGLSGDRALRKLVSQARRGGIVICSCDSGYFLPNDRKEIEKFYRTTRAKALSTLTILRSARMALNETDGQLEIEGGD